VLRRDDQLRYAAACRDDLTDAFDRRAIDGLTAFDWVPIMGASATHPRGVCNERRHKEHQRRESGAADITVFHEGKNGAGGDGFHHAGVSGAMPTQRSQRG